MAIVLVVGFSIFQQENIISNGETVILETRPVDPRDFLKGEYVILNYRIATDEKVLTAVSQVVSGDSIYIKLEKSERGIGEVAAVETKRPKTWDGLWLRGERVGNNVEFPNIAQYYVPEGAGLPIERLRSDLCVRLVIKDGEARVDKLLDADLNEIDVEDYIER